MIRLTLYTRYECHLCDAAKFVLRKVQCTHPFELVEVDISAPGNDALLEKYKHDIPVICCGDEEWFRHRVVESDLRDRLKRRAKANWRRRQASRSVFTRSLFPGRRQIPAYTFNRHEGVPEAYWRQIKPTIRISSAVSVIYFIVLFMLIGIDILISRKIDLAWTIGIGVLFLFIGIGTLIANVRAHKSFLQRLRNNDNLLCLVCGYVLVGLPETHECPECGQPYNLEQTRLAWSNWQLTGDMSRSEWG